MIRALTITLLLLACKRDDKPTPAPPRAFGIAAEIRAQATLVPGTWRFAIRAGSGWYESPVLANNAGLGAAITAETDAVGGLVDIFLGATPIVAGGEEHREQHVRIAPMRTAIAFAGLATKIESTRDGREVWAYTHELTKHLAFVTGTTVEHAPSFERLAPVPDSVSPVSRRLCEVPSVQDIAVADRFAYALVVECNEDAPLRVIAYDGNQRSETRLPSRRALGATYEKLVVSKTGAVLVGVRDGKLALDRVTGTDVKPATFAAVSRVFSVVIAEDAAVWTFVLDGAGKPAILRDGTPVDLEHRTPTTLAHDSTLGVVVLAAGTNATWLYAEHPPATTTVITP